MLGEEEMAIFLIVGSINLERGELDTTARRHTLAGTLLLRHHGLQFQFTKLHVGTNTEERAGSSDQ